MLEQVQDAKTWASFHFTRWFRPEGVLLDGLARGLGRRTFTLTEAESRECSRGQRMTHMGCMFPKAESGRCARIQGVIEEIDQMIRRAPSPVGIGDFLIRVRVFKRPPHEASNRRQTDWHRLLAYEFSLAPEEKNYLISRYHDWKHGDAQEQLATLLCKHCPTPDLPLVEIAVTSIGQLIVDLIDEQRIIVSADWEHDESVPSVLS